MPQNATVICGGSGSSKFATAISKYACDELNPTFITNVGDNFWWHGLLVCPDVDIITYALSETLDSTKGWGVKDDSWNAKESLAKSADSPEWFNLGDRDLALCLKRTELYIKGWSLSSITREIAARLGAKDQIVPASDDRVQTFIRTAEGNLHLQEFWVKNKGNIEPFRVSYEGIKVATATKSFLEACKNPVIICPANPITSILPSVDLQGIKTRLRKTKVVAISPFVGQQAFSGPAASLMHAAGFEASSSGVANLYSDFLRILILDSNEDLAVTQAVKDLGIEAIRSRIMVRSEEDKRRIAKELASFV